MSYLPEKYTYTNELQGRSVYALSPAELFETLRVNDCLGPKTGQYVYVRAFGPMPLIFCAPMSVRLYRGSGSFNWQCPYDALMAIELAIASGATVVFPLRTFYDPRVDPAVQTNPLLCTLSDVIEKLGAGLVIEVRTRYIDIFSTKKIRLSWRDIYIDDEFGLATLGWPRLVDLLQLKCAPTPLRTVTPAILAEHTDIQGMLPVWVRKTCNIPALSLSFTTEMFAAIDPYSQERITEIWEQLKTDFSFPLPEITYQTLLVKQERERRGSISFADELRLSGGAYSLSAPAGSSPFTGQRTATPERIDEILERVFEEQMNGQS